MFPCHFFFTWASKKKREGLQGLEETVDVAPRSLWRKSLLRVSFLCRKNMLAWDGLGWTAAAAAEEWLGTGPPLSTLLSLVAGASGWNWKGQEVSCCRVIGAFPSASGMSRSVYGGSGAASPLITFAVSSSSLSFVHRGDFIFHDVEVN